MSAQELIEALVKEAPSLTPQQRQLLRTHLTQKERSRNEGAK